MYLGAFLNRWSSVDQTLPLFSILNFALRDFKFLILSYRFPQSLSNFGSG